MNPEQKAWYSVVSGTRLRQKNWIWQVKFNFSHANRCFEHQKAQCAFPWSNQLFSVLYLRFSTDSTILVKDARGKVEVTKRLELEEGWIKEESEMVELLTFRDEMFRSRTPPIHWNCTTSVEHQFLSISIGPDTENALLSFQSNAVNESFFKCQRSVGVEKCWWVCKSTAAMK